LEDATAKVVFKLPAVLRIGKYGFFKLVNKS